MDSRNSGGSTGGGGSTATLLDRLDRYTLEVYLLLGLAGLVLTIGGYYGSVLTAAALGALYMDAKKDR